MRFLTFTLLSVIILDAQADSIVCARTAKRKELYPYNDAAIKLARDLDLKTCTRSDRFKLAVNAGKHQASFVTVSEQDLANARKKLDTMLNNTATTATGKLF